MGEIVWNTMMNSKYPSKCHGSLCPAIGNAGVIAVLYQPLLSFVLFVVKDQVVVSCVVSVYQISHIGFLRMWNIILGFPPWERGQDWESDRNLAECLKKYA